MHVIVSILCSLGCLSCLICRCIVASHTWLHFISYADQQVFCFYLQTKLIFLGLPDKQALFLRQYATGVLNIFTLDNINIFLCDSRACSMDFVCIFHKACVFVSQCTPAITLQGVHVQNQIYCLLSATRLALTTRKRQARQLSYRLSSEYFYLQILVCWIENEHSRNTTTAENYFIHCIILSWHEHFCIISFVPLYLKILQLR